MKIVISLLISLKIYICFFNLGVFVDITTVVASQTEGEVLLLMMEVIMQKKKLWLRVRMSKDSAFIAL